MKKIIKHTIIGMLFLVSISFIQNVKAETYTGQAIWPSEFISNIYIKKVKPDGYTKYQQARFIRRSEDNSFVYCLQPYAEIDNNLPYYNVARSDYASVLNMSLDDWNRISLIAYYGYGYNENGYNHSSQKWYAISQVMIWRMTNKESDIYFTDSLNGNRINAYENEINEINSLVNNHYNKPNFNANDVTLPIGQSITLNDVNNSLSNFNISSTENAIASINENNLTITATSIGTAKVNLVKKASNYEIPPIVYFSDHSQNVFRVGHYDPIYQNFQIKVTGGKVEINKVDNENLNNTPQGEGTLANAVYGVYNTSNELITKLTTDNNSYAISGYLPSLGEYYIKEITPSKGYNLDKNKYSFKLDENNLLASITVFESVIKRDVEITKVFADEKTTILTPESNVEFGFYNNRNELYKKVKTDNNGRIYVTLPYGTYTIKQLTSTPSYEKVKDFNISISETGDVLRYVISNAGITAKLKVVKIDKDSGNVIKRSNIKFKIFNIDKNEYVKQTITYPKAQTLSTFETDNNGILITPYPLEIGNYRLEEVDQVIDGYIWNSESFSFSINEQSKLITDNEYGILFEVKFSNKQVKGSIELTKYGEEVIYENNTYSYNKILLENVKYDLYASEDIYSADGTKIYDKDELVTKAVTNETGKFIIDNLYLGKYYLLETESSRGNIIDNTKYEITLDYLNQYTKIVNKSMTLYNYLPKGKLELSKIDLESKNVLSDTILNIYTENDVLVFSGKTDKAGKIVIEDLPYGKYYIKEIEARNGYILNTENLSFEIKEDEQKVLFTNKQVKGSVEITKYGEEVIYENNTYSYNKILLENVKYDLYASEDIYSADGTKIYDKDELVTKAVTNETGKFIIDNLYLGKYYLLETESSRGNVIDTTKHEFKLEYQNQYIEVITSSLELKNHFPKGTLEFTKLDFSNSKTLPNTLIEVYTENDVLVFSGRTDATGKIVIKDLPYGKYYIKEIEAPKGYTLNLEKMYFEILEDKEIVKSNMTDELIVEVPNTLENEYPIIEIISGLIIIGGIGLIIYAKKKK